MMQRMQSEDGDVNMCERIMCCVGIYAALLSLLTA